ncbi:MAG: amino acid ABC transporter permease [Aquabacterium sp.]|nr:amino acid ABC transporter permease [Aquabacterium sp.]
MSRSPLRLILQALSLSLLAWLAFKVLNWAVFNAVFEANATACQALAHQGACWGVVPEKIRPILLGHYPYESQWRPISVLASIAVLCLLAWRAGWRRMGSNWFWLMLLATLSLDTVLMSGGVWGLSHVPIDNWGGLPLTFWLFGVSLLGSIPLAMALALARRSKHVLVSAPATMLIETIRGVPLVTILFMAAFIVPILLPPDSQVGLVWRAALALTCFSAVYMAEVIRAGLQTIPAEQSEAAAVLGPTWWQTQRQIVLPQALRAVLPTLVGHAIGLLKDSSLVLVIGLHELTGGLSLSLGGDPIWRPFYLEAYMFVGAIYMTMCLGLSRAGRSLEQRWTKASA